MSTSESGAWAVFDLFDALEALPDSLEALSD